MTLMTRHVIDGFDVLTTGNRSMLKSFSRTLAVWLALATPASAAGTIPLAMMQQFDINGQPIQCNLYIFQVGTTATLQNVFSDFGLSIPTSNPLRCDATGRLPLFWLADGTVHARLTDAGGTPILDVPVLQVLGPSSGGGGGGGGTDPATIASTGDIKFRASSDVLTGWVKLNALTIGSAVSGATGRANADTASLFVYLWNVCIDAHCPVIGGRGANGLADFNANKQITLPDMRSRMPFGRDQMEGAGLSGRLLNSNVTSGGGDSADTNNATGGESNHVLTVGELAAHNHAVGDPGHNHAVFDPGHNHAINITDPGHAHGTTESAHVHSYNQSNSGNASFTAGGVTANSGLNAAATGATSTGLSVNSALTGITSTSNNSVTGIALFNAATGVTTLNTGSSTAHNTMAPFMLGSWYMKL